jgi:S1-C subfamily serine protease
VVAAGGAPVTTVDELHRALDAAASAGTLAVRVVRGTDEIDLDLTFTDDGT